MKKLIIFILSAALILSAAACAKTETPAAAAKDSATPEETAASDQPADSVQPTESVQPADSVKPSESVTAKGTPELTLIGHNSFKIKSAEGVVVYVDPYAEGDYNEPADIILVSHEHGDHNQIKLCTQNDGCKVLRVKENINPDGSYNNYEAGNIKIEPVAAYNSNHPKKSNCGFVINLYGVVLYIAGDTSKIDEMAELKARNIDYAFFPIDGQYNMGAAEAMECAGVVGAKHNTPVHIFSADPAEFKPDNLLPVSNGEMIELKKG
jgi:L-ascorbate metabolism protein UlaG (beta-lactamase superfamily)